jgi:hypothetical protein
MIAMISVSDRLEIWVGALLTLMVFSFLYRDNPFYKFAEHLFVGVSAAYWMVLGFWTTLWPQVILKLAPQAERLTNPDAVPADWQPAALIPLGLGLLMLCRLVPRLSWLGKWATAFVLGTTAGYGLIRYLRSDFLYQLRATIGEGLLPRGPQGIVWSEALATMIILLGTICGLAYFVQTRERRGVHGLASRIGLLLIMVTFGVSFGSAVMGRIALLVGRIQELLGPWLGIL